VHYLYADRLGSTAVTSVDGTAAESQLAYLPYGSVWQSQGPVPTDRHFTGQREDSYINLYWISSRWYDPYHPPPHD
jgi:hypothetical protein